MMAQTTKNPGTAAFSDSLFINWVNGFDRVCTAQTEVENLFLQALDNQKETWDKLSGDISRIEEEQAKLLDELRESTKLNIQKAFGPAASKFYEQWNAQFDEVTIRVRELTVKPYKEGINLFNQSQEQFQQSVKSGITQQQKLREDIAEQVKTTQKVISDLYETNTKMVLGMFK